MSGKYANFADEKLTKSDIDDIDANKMLVSKERLYGTKNSFKYFIRYNDNDVIIIRPLCIKLLQMTGSVRKFEGNTTMSFKISDKQLLKKYNQIWKRVEKLLKIDFDSKSVYVDDNDKYIKTKIKIYGDSVNTNFQDKKMPKEKVPCKCYPQTFLEECKYEQEKIKMENLTDYDLEKNSSDESDNDSNDETEFDNDESSE